MSKLPEDRRSVFTDIYKYYEQFWDMPDDVDNWKKCAEGMGAVVSKHSGSVLARHLVLACYSAIEEEYKAVRRAIENA